MALFNGLVQVALNIMSGRQSCVVDIYTAKIIGATLACKVVRRASMILSRCLQMAIL